MLDRLRRWRAAAFKVALIAYLFLAVFAGNGLRSDELQCEEALVHLNECCPELEVSTVDCSFSADGCQGPVRRPLLSEATASCLKSRDCDAVVSAGACEEVAAAQAERDEDHAFGDQSSAQGICP